MSETEANLQVIRDAYAAFFAGDLDRFFDFYDENIVLVEAVSLPYGGTYHGRSAVRAAVMGVVEKWDKMTLEIHVLTAAEDYVIAYGTFSANGKATGKNASFPLAEVWRLKNGKIVFLNPVYGDTKMTCEALGV